jgi:catechol 2,3-dioxygenase-like lactoylglutathione lyase family enzyme
MRVCVAVRSIAVVALVVVGVVVGPVSHAAEQAKPAGGATFTGLGTNLVVKDFAKSLAFYRDTLGFSVVSALPPAAPHVFAWIQRGGVHVFLNDLATVQKDPVLTKRYKPGPGGVAMFVLMTGIDDLYGGIKGKATVTEPIETKAYGSREFTITDPDGYVITFSETIKK